VTDHTALATRTLFAQTSEQRRPSARNERGPSASNEGLHGSLPVTRAMMIESEDWLASSGPGRCSWALAAAPGRCAWAPADLGFVLAASALPGRAIRACLQGQQAQKGNLLTGATRVVRAIRAAFSPPSMACLSVLSGPIRGALRQALHLLTTTITTALSPIRYRQGPIRAKNTGTDTSPNYSAPTYSVSMTPLFLLLLRCGIVALLQTHCDSTAHRINSTD
jgi:hypothetical protein